ncbi:unnamed protein product [Somion occarium]|uniref:Uncharacterized protein n=1 Tax=Somion occarium TaxID=3059160 RepID=A0ABP1CVS3_9APHY
MESSKPQQISPSIAGGAQLIESLIDHVVARAVEKERIKHEALKSEIDEKWRPTCEQLEKQLLLKNDENEKLAARVAELEARLETQKSSKDECTCRSKVPCNVIPMPTPMSPPSSTLVDITMDDITLIPEESMCVDAYLTQCDSEEAAPSTLTPVPIPNHTLSIGHMINGEFKPDIDSMTQSHFAFQDQIHKGAAEDIDVDDSSPPFRSRSNFEEATARKVRGAREV